MARNKVRAFPQIATVPVTGRGEQSTGFRHVQAFLERFGYLPPSKYKIGRLDARTSRALSAFQKFNSLKPTGRYDDATRDAMTRPRCALPDVPGGRRFATACPWDRTNLTFALDTPTADVAGQAEWNAIRAAFRTWQALAALTFTEVGLTSNPDIRAGWRSAIDPDFNMVGGTIAHADFPPGCGVVTNTLPKPVHFDDSEHTWSVGAVANAFDVETVALHEIGHIVGLQHSPVAGAVMRPTINSNFTRRALSADDVAGFDALYPTRSVPDVRELRQANAANAIRAVRLVPRFTGQTGPGAWVYRQSPRADATVNVRSTVTLQLRTGPIP